MSLSFANHPCSYRNHPMLASTSKKKLLGAHNLQRKLPTELGSAPNQECLTLILSPIIASFADVLTFNIRVRNSGPKFEIFGLV